MTQDRDIDFINSDSLLKQTAKDIYVLAEEHHDDRLFLLSLLRDLEQIHRQVRVRYFQAALPETRNDLYRFVKDIEEQGGWPYIERMRLKDLLQNMNRNDSMTDDSEKKTDGERQIES
jgi:hemerythrin-like domain-containing protein